MSTDRDGRSDPTLLRLAGLVVLVLVAAASVDLARGRGGAAWLGGTGTAAEVSQTEPYEPATSTFFRGATVFDGRELLGRRDVLVSDGEIAAIGESLEVPDGAQLIEADGLTLLPGLVDSHVHTYGPALRSAVMVGVTTEIDMFTDAGFMAQMTDEQTRGVAGGRADLFSAGVLVTSPGGHGTEYGMPIPTLTSPEDADAFVQARVDEGSHFIKIVYDAGSLNRQFSSLDLATVTAVIAAAHARDKLAVVHVANEQDALDVIAAGADGIVHVFYDRPASDEAVARIRDSGAFVVPTLTVLESVTGVPGGRELASDTRLAPYLMPADVNGLETGFPAGGDRSAVLPNGLASIRALHAAGVPILAGTDAPNPGTAHGASLHRELELLVQAGLTAEQALEAATSTPAATFGLADRGRVQAGLRADLVLVHGDPTDDVTASRDIVGVWKGGLRVDRGGYRDEVAAAAAGGDAVATGSGLIADFDDGELTAEFGSGWMTSTDAMLGGTSSATLEVIEGGADGSASSLQVSGTLVMQGAFAWAGPMFNPGPQPFAPADLSAHEGFSFLLRGDGQPVTIMLFATSLGQVPAVYSLDSTADWTLHELDFGDFPGVDPAGLQAILFSGTSAGDFVFSIDELRLR